MRHCDCQCLECPADFVTSPDALRSLADDHRLCGMPAKFRWSMQRAAAEMARLRLTNSELEAITTCIRDDEASTAYDRAAVLRGLLERTQ